MSLSFVFKKVHKKFNNDIDEVEHTNWLVDYPLCDIQT